MTLRLLELLAGLTRRASDRLESFAEDVEEQVWARRRLLEPPAPVRSMSPEERACRMVVADALVKREFRDALFPNLTYKAGP